MAQQMRHFAFTWNNYPEDVKVQLKNIYRELDANFLVAGLEEAPTTGTPHVQGYIQLNKRKTFKTVTKIFGGKVHISPALGSSQDNYDYVTKCNMFIELGEARTVGRARAKQDRDWELMINLASQNKLEQIRLDNPKDYLIYYNTLHKIAASNLKPEAMSRFCLWVWGKPGVGKSRFVHETWPEAYWKNANKWWDGYTNQEVAVLDDLGTDVLAEHLKRWADRYKIVGEIKGGSLGLVYTTFVVTSNFHPKVLFQDTPQATQEAILRRFQVVEALRYQNNQLFVKFGTDDEIDLIQLLPLNSFKNL